MKVTVISALALATAVVGQTVLHPSIGSNKCVEVRGNVQANGTAVQIFDCNGTASQFWQINLGPTTVRLANSNFCLDAGLTPGNGTLMKVWECVDNISQQQWVVNLNGRISLANTDLCLDLTNGVVTNTNVLQVWQCTSGNTNQIWTN